MCDWMRKLNLFHSLIKCINYFFKQNNQGYKKTLNKFNNLILLSRLYFKIICYLIIVHNVFAATVKIITNKVIITNVMWYTNIIQIILINFKIFWGFIFRCWKFSRKKSESDHVKLVISEEVSVGQNAFNS